jgi:hypothetical protein
MDLTGGNVSMRNRMLGLLLVLLTSGRVAAQGLPAYGPYPVYPPPNYPVQVWSVAAQQSAIEPGETLPPATPQTTENGGPAVGMWYDEGSANSVPIPSPSRQPGLSPVAKWLRGDQEPNEGADSGLPDLGHQEADIPDRAPSGGRFYGSADALLWWLRRGGTPILATTGTGVNPLAGPLVKDNNFDDQQRLGARATLGIWLDLDQTVGFEVGGLYLFQRTPNAKFISGGTQPLARPFFDAATGLLGADILAGGGTQAGGLAVRDLTRFWSAEANLRHEALRGCYYHLDLLCGFRFLQFDEGMQISDQTTFLPASPFAGTSVASSDRFGTHNAFYGGQLGLETEFHLARVDLDLWGKVGLGTNFQVLNINGTTIVVNPDGTSTGIANGLYAQPTNIGHHTETQFTVVPEFGVNVGLQLSSHLRATAGYTFLYMSRLVRPGDQIDQTVSPIVGAAGAAAAGASRPAVLFHESDFWVQGLNVGLEFRY